MALLESVPNVSEGRDASVGRCDRAPRSRARARGCSTRIVDGDHNRAVITLVGDDRAVEEGLVAGIDEARRRIDLRTHDGVHPRVGAADVVPVVPLAAADLGRAVDVALAVGARVGDELGLPVFLYGEIGDGRRPAFFRRGGPGELQRRVDAGELEPAFGPRRLDPRGRRRAARACARRSSRSTSSCAGRSTSPARSRRPCASRPAGCPGVQALGLRLGGGRIQVSTNVVDLDATPPHVMVERIVAEAAARGAGRGARGARRAAPGSLRRGRRAGRGDRRSRSTTAAFRGRRRSTAPRGRCGSSVSTPTVWSSGTPRDGCRCAARRA